MAKLQGKSKLVTHRLNLGYFKNMHLWYQLLENIVNCFTDCIVVNSGAVKQQVLRQERCLPRCIKVIYAGIDIDKFRPVPGLSAWPSIFQQKYGIPANSSIVAMIANLRFLKGYREFILAAADIHQQYPDVYFLCVGQNPLLCQDIQQELHALAQQLGIGPQLIFTGQVQNIPELLEMITIQVSASYEEGFSSAILEGMASEKPIVATAVGGTPEQLQHEHTGLLVPPRNTEALGRAVLRYLDKPEFARQIGRNARIYAEDHFALNKTIPQLEQLYLQLLHSSE